MTQNRAKNQPIEGKTVEIVHLDDHEINTSASSPSLELQVDDAYNFVSNLPPFLKNDTKFLGIKA